MAHDWRTPLFTRLRKAAEEQGTTVRFPLYFMGKEALRTEVVLVGSTLRVQIGPAEKARLDALDRDAILSRWRNDSYRKGWLAQVARVQSAVGKTVTLNTFATVLLLPVEFKKRTTPSLNVYEHFFVRPKELASLLSAEEVAPLPAEMKLNEFGYTLFPPDDAAAPDPADTNDDDDNEEEEVWTQHHNVIFFGPPGTGKSYQVQEVATQHLAAAETLRITFHPESTYFDFVGSFRPAVGWVKSALSFTDADGAELQREPRTYYRFEPGPLSLALQAASTTDKPVVLIIEEINRGNVAGIFGDVFQLLDRVRRPSAEDFGWSEYPIRPSAEWSAWLRQNCPAVFMDGRLRLPGNLYLYATMNTSDQSLYPMDTAFRRRWGLQYVGLHDSGDPKVRVPLHAKDEDGVSWLKVMRELNAEIVDHTRTDDKQMGPWFVRASIGSGDLVDPVEFQSKVLFYLWSDVFRDRPERIFHPKIRTYEQLVRRFGAGKPVLRDELLEKLGVLHDAE